MNSLRHLIREAHRRSLWQVLGVYLAGSWLALQVVQTLSSSIGLPDWVPAAAVALLVVGLPLVAATAVVQEGPPRRDVDVLGADESAVGDPASHQAAGPRPATGHSEPAAGSSRFLSWRNAFLGGAAAFLLLSVAASLYMAGRALGIGPAAPLAARGVLDVRLPIVLADFSSATGDTLLARTATEALRIDLGSSPVVRLADPVAVHEALLRMRRDPDAVLTTAVGRELALREGMQAVIGGEINRAGTGYLLSASVVSAEGSVLTSHRVSAPDSTGIIAAIDRLSGALRKEIGESIRSVAGGAPLEKVTTSSLEALRAYTEAVRAEQVDGESQRAIYLLEEAVALDPDFAMAWRKLGIVLSNYTLYHGVDLQDRQRTAVTRAFELRHRLTESERYQAEAAYHFAVRDDYDAVIIAYENLLRLDSTNTVALNNLAIIHGLLGHGGLGVAEDFHERAMRSAPSDIAVLLNAVETKIRLGKLVEASRLLRQARSSGGANNPRARELEVSMAAIGGRWREAELGARQLLEAAGNSADYVNEPSLLAASLPALRGRVEEAAELARRHLERVDGRMGPHRILEIHGWLARLHLHVLADTARAARLVETAEQRMRPERPGISGTVLLTRLYAELGAPSDARRHLERLESRPLTRFERRQTMLARAAVRLAEGDATGAVESLERAGSGPCLPCSYRLLAVAHDRAGLRDSARAYFERALRSHDPYQLPEVALHRANTLLRLGELLEAEGRAHRASEMYRRLVALWAEADPTLQPRVEEARRRVERLTPASESSLPAMRRQEDVDARGAWNGGRADPARRYDPKVQETPISAAMYRRPTPVTTSSTVTSRDRDR